MKKILLFLVSGLFLLSSIGISAPILDLCQILDKDNEFYKQFCTEKKAESGYYSSSSSSVISPIGRTSEMVMTQLVIPKEKSIAYKKLTNLKNNAGPILRYEDIEIDKKGPNEEADIYGTTLMWARDLENISVGLMVPYDYFDFDNSEIDNINQVGIIIFGQYKIPLASDTILLTLTGDVNYFYADIDRKHKKDDNLNSVGLGGGLSLKALKWEKFIPSIGVSYHYTDDDTKTSDHYLLKAGTNLAFLPTEKLALNLFAVWNNDPTDYYHGDNDDYWDLGIEINFLATQTWNLTIGYKKVVDLEDFDSDQFYVGAIWKF